MPEVITLGHVLIVLAAIAVIAALSSAGTAMRHGGHGRGTPQYARARLARRHVVYAVTVALVLLAASLSPLREVALMGGGA